MSRLRPVRRASLGVGVIALILALAGLATAAPVPPVNPPPLPSSFYGTVKQPGGANIANGTPVSAFIGSTKVAETASFTSGTDSVYRIDVPADFPDTPAVEGGQEGQTVTIQVGGVPVQTATWHSTSYVRQDLVLTPLISNPQAAFTTSKARNAALAGDGATVVGFSSEAGTPQAAANVIDNTTAAGWTSAFGQPKNQFIKVQLAPGPQVVDQVIMKGFGGASNPRNFRILVSNTTGDDSAFTTVLTAEAQNNSLPQTFTFASVGAKFVELFIVDNYGDPGTTQLAKFEVWTPDRQGGIVSWPYGPQASVAGFSSGSTPDGALDDSIGTGWQANGATNQFLKVQLGGAQTFPINRVRLLNDSNIGVKDFDIRVSTTTADDSAFSTVFSGTAAADGTHLQEFSFATVQARYVELFAKSGYNSAFMEVETFQAITPDGANAARLGGVGAFVITSTGFNGNNSLFDPKNAIDADPTSVWITPQGQTTNQFIKVLLTENSSYLIDRVQLLSSFSTNSVKDFQVRVSTTTPDDAAFTTIVNGTLPRDGQEHWFSFAPVEAKYVELLVLDDQGSPDFVSLGDFEVFSPQRGGATVPFIDLSTESGGSIASWNWDFGDGSTSTAEFPVHTYTAPGVYPVTLSVLDTGGRSGTTTSSYTVEAPLVPSFSWTPLTPNEGQSATLTDTSTGTEVARQWSVSGGSLDFPNSASSSVFLPQSGTYSVTLAVTDQDQVTTSITQQVTVLNVAPTVTLPVAFYAIGGREFVNPGLNVVFDPAGAADAVQCQWDFGDGSVSTFSTTNCVTLDHTFAEPPSGTRSTTYHVTLTARDKDGGVGSGTGQVFVGHPLPLTKISTGFHFAIGVDYHEPSNQALLSVNYSGGVPYNFELVAPDGSRTQFSNVSGLTDEVYMTSVRSSACEGGFTVGETFTGTGQPGEIARISPDGSSALIPWVRLPGETGLLRGGLFQDRYCAMDGDLIVVTTTGSVWRVSSAGVATRLVNGFSQATGGYLEGVTTIPNDPAHYGPWAGKVLTGNENNGCVYSVDAQGTTQCWLRDILGTGLGTFSPETELVLPPNQNFIGVDYSDQVLVGASAADLADMVGDVLVTSEVPGALWDVHWDPATQAFQPLIVAVSGQFEGSAVSPAGIQEIKPVLTQTPTPTPTSTTTATLTPTATETPTMTPTPTVTASVTATATSTVTPTLTPTATPSLTPSPSVTPTSTATVVADSSPPSCVLTAVGTDTLNRRYLQITLQDAQSGLASVTVMTITNSSADVGSYLTGITTAPTTVLIPSRDRASKVVVTDTRLNPSLASSIVLKVMDVAGNVTSCDPQDVTVDRVTGKPVGTSLTGVSQTEHYLEIANDSPGLTNLAIRVNGAEMQIAGLKDGETRELDLSPWLVPGGSNIVELTPLGRPGGAAWVMIADQPLPKPVRP